jgi:hypothetical protein
MAIRHEPAECHRGCLDDNCPYTHDETWTVIGEDDGQEYGPFFNRQEAVACHKAHLLPEGEE